MNELNVQDSMVLRGKIPKSLACHASKTWQLTWDRVEHNAAHLRSHEE